MNQLILAILVLVSSSRSAEISSENSWECVSPKAECDLTTCLPLYLCPELIHTVGNITFNSTADEIPEQYLCQKYGKNLPCVCCPLQDEESPPFATAPEAQNIDKSYLIPPSFECCDRKSVLYSYGGMPIGVGEFPSLALLHYVDSSGNSSFPCAGTLISKQYVLTAAHCVTGKILEKAGKLTKIRLGEHDLSNTICVDGKCNHGVMEVEIDEVIVHEEYVDKQKSNDITLIRLAKPLKHFQLNILPICLRWIHGSPSPTIEPNHKFTVVGWGRTLQERQSKIGNKVYLPHYDRNECAERYTRYKLDITDKQICAGGEFKVDACDGDSGGPLLSKIDECDYLDGIVSFGRGCGLENWPGVYTNVTAYRDWIMKHIEP